MPNGAVQTYGGDEAIVRHLCVKTVVRLTHSVLKVPSGGINV